MRIVAPLQKNPASEAKFAKKNFFFARQCYTLYELQIYNLRPLLSITFPQGFQYLKSLDIGFREVRAKKFRAKLFKSETTSFHNFLPRIPNI